METTEVLEPNIVPDLDHLRTSSYVIYVDLPDDNDEWLLLHGYTGAYDRVSRRMAQFIRSREVVKVPKPLYGSWKTDELSPDSSWSPSNDEIEILIRRGYLTQKSVDEELEYFAGLVGDLHTSTRHTQPHYVIMPTYDCNLRCHYCFQDQFRTNGAYSHLLRVMTIEMADKIMSSFDSIEQDIHGLEAGSALVRKFTFFGGEPLLAKTQPIVEYIVRKQQSLGPCSFLAVTNATELDAYESLLGPDGISTIQITIDGTEEQHDRRRIRADGSGSFSAIARNLDMALRLGVNVSVRVNVDRANSDQLPDLARVLAERGWPTNPLFQAYLAPIFDYSGLGNAGERADFFNTWELGNLLKEMHSSHPITRVFSKVDGSIRSQARNVLATNGRPSAKASYCGAHNGMYLFDPLGDIYACWDRTGDEKLRIGRVLPEGKIEINGLGNHWRSRTVASNPVCRQCRFALSCGGGCAVLAEVSSGSIDSNFCDAFGKRFRVAVAEAYKEFSNVHTALADRPAVVVSE